jgi:catechol 2,3-dioxygenase
MAERIRDIAHLSTVELYTPTFEESLWFFTDLLAMREVGRTTVDGVESAYLHCWDDYEPYSIKFTAQEHAGVGRVGWRANSPEALERVVARIEASGHGEGWVDGEQGRGRTYRYTDPDRHLMEVYYDTEWYQPTDEDRPVLKNQASKFPGFGANARRLDHLNYLTADMAGVCDFTEQVMGGFTTEFIQLDDGEVGGHWFTYGQKSYDVVYSDDWTGTPGRLPRPSPAARRTRDWTPEAQKPISARCRASAACLASALASTSAALPHGTIATPSSSPSTRSPGCTTTDPTAAATPARNGPLR